MVKEPVVLAAAPLSVRVPAALLILNVTVVPAVIVYARLVLAALEPVYCKVPPPNTKFVARAED